MRVTFLKASSVSHCNLYLILVFCAGVKSYVQGSSLLCRGKVLCVDGKSSVQVSSLLCRGQVFCDLQARIWQGCCLFLGQNSEKWHLLKSFDNFPKLFHDFQAGC